MIPTNKAKCCNVKMRHPTMGTVVLKRRRHPRTKEVSEHYAMRKWAFCPFCGKGLQ